MAAMVEAEADISILPVGLMVAMPMDPMDMETIMRITGKTESSSGLAAEEVVVPYTISTTETLVVLALAKRNERIYIYHRGFFQF